MKIILTDSRSLRNSKAPWIYFGGSYLNMKKYENKLSGKRINLQDGIHNSAVSQKKLFLEWVENQRKKNEDSIYWWMTQIAGRNNAQSNFFLSLCQFFAIKNYLEKNTNENEINIICEDIFLLKFLSQNFRDKFTVKTPNLINFFWFYNIILLVIRGILNQTKTILRLVLHYVCAKITKPKKLSKPTENVYLFHHCLDEKIYFQENTLTCKYFTILPNWLKKKGFKVFGLPWFFNNKASIDSYKKLRNSDCFIPEDWINFFDYFTAFSNSIKSIKTLNNKIIFPGVKIDQLILREKILQLSEPSIFFWRYIPAFKKWSEKLKSITIYDQYENMMFEHPLRYIAKKLPIKSTSVGFYHSLVSKEFMPYHYLNDEWKSQMKPDYIACIGSFSKNLLLKQGVPEKKIILGAALRQSNSLDKEIEKKPSRQILILLSLITEASAEILLKIHSINSFLVNELKLKIKVKAHPMMKTETILKKINWNKLPEGWEWAKKDLDDELDDSYCTISMFTASIYDAVIKKNIAVSIMSDLNLMDNYLDLFSDKYPLAYSVSQKELSLKLKDIFISKTEQYKDEFSKMRNELINGTNKINSQNLDAFIPQN